MQSFSAGPNGILMEISLIPWQHIADLANP